MVAKESLKHPRANICLAVIIDKFILALGGNSDKKKSSEICEVYDSQENTWHTMNPLHKARSATTACVVNHRYVYVFPGQNQLSWNSIEQLDLGTTIDVKGM
jgi:N-acetylneuraminic acid mutarotase